MKTAKTLAALAWSMTAAGFSMLSGDDRRGMRKTTPSKAVQARIKRRAKGRHCR